MAVTAKGYDYAWGRPGVPALKADGAEFVCRYLYPHDYNPDDGGKNLTLQEANTLIAGGIKIVSNFESWASRALEGRAAGVDDARAADAHHHAVGGPVDRPIYFSVDFDTNTGSYGAVADYFRGVISVIGLARTGAYGEYEIIKYLLDNSLIRWGWQTYAWSAGKYEERCQLSQDQNGLTLNGCSVDLDHAHTADYGQWPGEIVEDDFMPKLTDDQQTELYNMVKRIDFGLVPGGAVPFSERGEVTNRTRAIQASTKALTGLSKLVADAVSQALADGIPEDAVVAAIEAGFAAAEVNLTIAMAGTASNKPTP